MKTFNQVLVRRNGQIKAAAMRSRLPDSLTKPEQDEVSIAARIARVIDYSKQVKA